MLYDFIENIKNKKKANESVETDKPMGQEMGQRSNSKLHVRARWGDKNVPKLFMVMVAQPGEFAKNQ